MRNDALGFFWEDRPVVKPPKAEKVKVTPPERTWEEDGYLPGLDAALRFDVPQMNKEQLFFAYLKQEWLLFDIECYRNFFQIAFMSFTTGRVVDFIQTDQQPLDVDAVRWIMEHFPCVGFNSQQYDMTMAALALAGKTCTELKEASDELIIGDHSGQPVRPQDILKRNKVKSLRDNVNHVDLIEVAPLRGSLKIYGGRLHIPRMQDLPFPVHRMLSAAQMAIVRYYCVNDLVGTAFMLTALQEQLRLREALSQETGIDLRSRSDAQIAESVIAQDIQKINGRRPVQPVIEPGTVYRYNVPHYMHFQTPTMQWVLDRVYNTQFIVGFDGAVGMPVELADLEIPIAGGVYRMGIGGLHSSEQSTRHVSDGEYVILDEDVESYYPRIMLNQGLYPSHLGPAFLSVYSAIVERRLAAKRRGDKVVSDSLKITINGSFGKLGSKYSVLYAPDLLIQVTLTGQLTLFMLIEMLEMNGIRVVSANTDGIAIKCPRALRGDVLKGILKWWEDLTQFKLEETEYRALYSRDVNNYIAVKTDGGTKTKGAFANPWATEKNKDERLKKNPTNQICIDAVTGLLVDHIPVNDTIRRGTDIRKFVCVRNVKGGAVKDGTYLGKAIRWYYAAGTEGTIIYANSGKKVPRSEGAKPLMELPAQLPDDVDFDWYVAEAENILKGIGYEM